MSDFNQAIIEEFRANAGIVGGYFAGANLLLDSAFQDDHGIALGSTVTVAAETFGPEATEGELIAATRTHYTLRRTDPRVGTVHVHFPRIGYVLKKAETP